jgi:serine/threonine protein kinase
VEPKRLRGQLTFESHVYEILRSENGFPHLRKFGEDNLLSVNYLAMDLLGPTVEDLFNFCDKSFSLKIILMLIEQLLCRLECIHSKGIIHRDIKPDNLVMGLNHMSKTVMMIDFGIAKFFRKRNQPFDHIDEDAQCRRGRGIVGTPRYCSLHAHRGENLSALQVRENLETVHRAWKLAYGHIRHSLAHGFYQGWDLHPGQIPVRYAANECRMWP